MSSRQKKITVTAIAVILILVLGLAGTFAASDSTESGGNVSGIIDTSIVLHDDFSKEWTGDRRDRDVYVENTGESSLYVRVRLDEFMKYGGKILAGTGGTIENKAKWKPHIPAGKDITECATGIHDYFTIQMGNDTAVKYKSGVQNAYKEGTAEADKTETGPAAKVVLIKDYLKAVNKPDPCWILDDKDGYAYWYTQLKSNEATGLILNSITNTGIVDESYYYGINAIAEAVTEADLNAWLNGRPPIASTSGKAFDEASGNAKRLLKEMSPKYIKITEEMNLTTPPASEYDGDNDGYLTAREYIEYQKLNPTLSLTDASAFPDERFREALSVPEVDKDGDRALTMGERETITKLDVSNKGIESLTGIDKFPNLKELSVSGNHLTKLNLSKNLQLTNVNAGGQTTEIRFENHDEENGIYRSAPGLFASGTTFGKEEVLFDDISGAVLLKDSVTDARVESTFATPITYTKSKSTGQLTGTITLIRNEVVCDVQYANTGDIITVRNAKDDYGKTTDWYILNKDENEAVLITVNPVTSRKFHLDLPYPTWPSCDLRKWLNSIESYEGTGYLDTLSEDMKRILKKETLKTAHSWSDWANKDESVDSIYILTETWSEKWTGSGKVGINPDKDATSSLLTTDQIKCAGTWWLRSAFCDGRGGSDKYCRNVNGSSGAFTFSIVTGSCGVRPVVTINLK